MATTLKSTITRVVQDEHGKPMTVTLTADGILFRRPRKRDSYLLPYGVAETRAQVLAAGGVGMAATRTRGKHTVSRGLLTTER